MGFQFQPWILVADDSEAKRYLVSSSLRREGYTVEEATSGKEALEKACLLPAVILLDVHMPVMDGFEVLARLKCDPLTSDIPVLLISASFVTSADRVRGLDAGASGYLASPEPSEILANARMLVRGREVALEREALVRQLEASRSHLQAVLEQLPCGALLAEAPSGRITFGNTRMASIIGRQPRSLPAVEDYAGTRGFRVDGTELQPHEWPLARSIQSGETIHGEEIALLRDDGERRTVRIGAAPIRGAGGRIHAAVSTVEDISDRKELEESLRRRVEFEQELIGIVSHDLRNPIQVILLSARHLSLRQDLDDRERRGLERIVSSTERASRMIRDLLDFTRARLGGGLPIAPAPCDLHQVTRHCVEEVQIANPGRAVELVARGDGSGRWDADRIGQVIANLVGNALRHSPPEAFVRVETRGTEDAVTLEVMNGGPPIDPADLPFIFEPLRRGRRSKPGGGIGLGLYISRKLVEAHGGQLGVTSDAEHGTRFKVSLPR